MHSSQTQVTGSPVQPMTWTFYYSFYIIFLNGWVTALRHFLTSYHHVWMEWSRRCDTPHTDLVYYTDISKFLEKFCWVIGMTFSSHRQDSNLLLQKSWHFIKKILEIPARKSFNSLNQRTLPVPCNQLFWKSRDFDERRFVYVVILIHGIVWWVSGSGVSSDIVAISVWMLKLFTSHHFEPHLPVSLLKEVRFGENALWGKV